MRAIISLVEGKGDKQALPTLITKVLSDLNNWNWYPGPPIIVHSLGRLRKQLEWYLSNAASHNNCGAILIELDLDDGCPKKEALQLAEEIRLLNLAVPVAIVFACREYEAWFLASLPTIAGHYGLPKDLIYEGDVESKRDVKGWLRAHMPQRRKYTPTSDQKRFTSLIDLELAHDKSRSFQRFYHAIEQLLEAAEKGERGYVSPLPK
ncbi:MAG: DUF4276 family protein [Ardenticatenaceae bacterium]